MLSYDGLNILQKKIFLHIACFFKGKERRRVTRVLDAIGIEAVSGITVLIEKSLLTTSNGELHMHDLIQEMGQCIVRECYPNTMVWVPEEIDEVMTTISRLEAVEAMVEPKNIDRPITGYSAELLKSMKKLRLFNVQEHFTSDAPTCFPEQLRWLSWSHYPFQSLRITRDMTKLVGLKMTKSFLRQLPIENKVILPNLKFINLYYSQWITMFPSVLGTPNLEWLNLSQCGRLAEVHESVFLHEKIIYLNLSFCRSLEILPSCIKMKSLQTLLLNHCRRLKTFPEVSMDMERLSLLHIHACYSLRALPSSIRLLSGLTTLTMGRSFGLAFEQEVDKTIVPNLLIQGSLHLNYLRVLDLGHSLLDDSFPSDLHIVWPSLEELNLYGNMFTQIPAAISQLSHLKHLDISDCIHLKELHELPPLIQVLKADGCTSLEKIGDLSNTYKWLFKISFGGCPKLLEDGESERHIANLLMKSLVQKCAAVNHRLSIMVHGSKIPNWFISQRLGNKIELYLPHSQISKVIGLAICCRQLVRLAMNLIISFKPSYEGNSIDCPTHPAKSVDGVWVGYMPIDILGNLCHGFEYENLVISFEDDHVVECGVCVVYKDDIKPMTRNGSWISDYDELGKINHHSATNEDLQHGRWSLPTFNFIHEKNNGYNFVRVRM